MHHRAFLLAGLLAALTSAAGAAPKRGLQIENASVKARRALVIGNQSYAISALENPVRDAKDIAKTLGQLGYIVTLVTDADMRRLSNEIDTYAETLGPSDVSFFYYSGHGVQVEGVNYLIPIDFAARNVADMPFAAYALDRLTGRLKQREPAMSVIVLDACRDNPFVHTRGGPHGLAGFDAARGSVVAFATSPGDTASDGAAGGNGTYTSALLKHLGDPVEVEVMFKRVGQDVYDASEKKQVPWISASVMGSFCVVGGACGAVAEAAPRDTGAAGGSLELTGEPAGAAVKISGPGGFAQEGALPLTLLNLHPGMYVVATSAKAYEANSLNVEVASGQVNRQRVTLKRGAIEADLSGMIAIPGGTFTMGSEDGGASELPLTRVTLSAYHLDRTEVSVAQYRKCVDEGHCSADDVSKFPSCNWSAAGRENHPMNCVSWVEADAFCRNRGARLPTEAEWEFAARGTENRRFPWGNAEPDASRACYQGTCSGTVPVTSLSAGANPLGVLNLAGNVWEWVADAFAPYPGGTVHDPLQKQGSTRVFRGGSWNNNATRLRVSYRNDDAPTGRDDYLGFRCAL